MSSGMLSAGAGTKVTEMFNYRRGLPNPMFDFLSGFMPRSLKDLFRWCEYLYFNNSNIYIGLQKQADYIITDVTYETVKLDLKEKYKELFNKHLHINSLLKAIQMDKSIYGNVVISINQAIDRMYYCKSCDTKIFLKHADSEDFKYHWQKCLVDFTCPVVKCDKRHSVHIDDFDDIPRRTMDAIRVIRWDIKLIDIEYNYITGEQRFWYKIPQIIRDSIKASNPLFITNMPAEFLKTVSDPKKSFLLPEENVLHLKNPAPAGIEGAFGLPKLTASLKKHYYAAVLRRANEAIAQGYIVPLRILSPQQTNSAANPISTISGAKWAGRLSRAFKQHRHDPLHVHIAPVGVSVTQIGGQGRALMTLGEINQAEEDIIASIGLFKEFIYGGLSWTGSSATLRMLENTLEPERADLIRTINWLSHQSAKCLKWEKIEHDMTPFKFIDDVQQKSLEINVSQSTGHLSTRSIAEMFGRDLDKERERTMEDTLAQSRMEKTLNNKMTEMENSLAQAAQSEAASNSATGLNYDQQAVYAQAEQIAAQWAQLPYEERRSEMSAMQNEDMVMYAVARMILSQQSQNQQGQQQQQ